MVEAYVIAKNPGDVYFAYPFQPHPSMERNTRVRQPPPNLPNKSLLLLGLQQLLNKSLSLPCAVVQPTSYNPIKSSCSPSKDGSSDSGSESDGPDKNEAQSNLRKRKRSATGDLSVVEKREKR